MNEPISFPAPSKSPRSRGQSIGFASAEETQSSDIPAPKNSAEKSEWRSRVRLAMLIFGLWTLIGLFLTIPESALPNYGWFNLLAKILDVWAWALLTPAILLIDRKLASLELDLPQLVLSYLVLSVSFSLVHTFVSGLFFYPFPQIWWSPLRNSEFIVYYYLGGWVTFWAIVGILQAYRYYNRYLRGQLQLERVERSLVESRLQALRLHLEPHFLFNALNAISSEVAANPKQARDMIGDLGALLRHSLECQDSPEITLGQELALLERYLTIQRIRFGDRMEITIDVDPDMHSVMVPSMILQPLVENAIRHGIERRLSGGKIVVSARRHGDQFLLHVIDNGVGLPRNWQLESSPGHGLRVTMERLEALHPKSGEELLSICRREGGGTQVSIQVPLKPAGVEQHEAIG